jgi:threonine dehydrogenase-like Zn-dependent dehydrogenase
MRGVFLPGARRVDIHPVAVPEPGWGEVLLRMRASTICGSDLRAIYREHTGTGAEAYQGVIAGHEPAGEIVAVGAGCRELREGDRVVVYHIAGCGMCEDCRAGYMVSCTSPARAAYGWQRDGGHADYLLAAETTCLRLPPELSFVDGACVACGFATAYEGLLRLDVSGRDRVAVTGLGPVGLAAGLLARAMGAPVVAGTDVNEARRALALDIGAVTHAFPAEAGAEPILDLTAGEGCEATIDCSGAPPARRTALLATRRRGRCAFIGEGGDVRIAVSPELIHRQITLHGSWVATIGHMAELLDRLVRWGLHPEVTVTHEFALEDAAAAYELADRADAGKVAITMPV